MTQESKKLAASVGYIVKFKKWDDPLKNAIRKASNRKAFGDYDDDEDDEGDFDNESSGPIAATDYGIVSINEEICVSTRFNFWEGRTNFPLENYHKFLIDTTLGVETNDIRTPYRFRIAIGPLFNEGEVLRRVEKSLVEYTKTIKKNNGEPENLNQEVAPPQVVNLHAILAKQHKFYAVFKFEGKNKVIGGATQEEVEQKVAEFTKTNNIQGNVEFSWTKGK